MSHFDEWLPLTFQVVLIQGDGVNALVNTGLPADLDDLNRLWHRAPGDPRSVSRHSGETIEEILAAAALTPDDITHVFLTPLQLYATDNVPLFRNAAICISRRGWIHFHTSHDHPHDNRWASIREEVLVHLVTDAWDRVRLLDDEDCVTPGLRTWNSGVHHRASITVAAETAVGTVAVSDSFFYAQNVLGGPPLGISESMEEHLRFRDRLAASAAHLVPLYDPGVFDRYRDGIIAP
jgi:hypothetical protein